MWFVSNNGNVVAIDATQAGFSIDINKETGVLSFGWVTPSTGTYHKTEILTNVPKILSSSRNVGDTFTITLKSGFMITIIYAHYGPACLCLNAMGNLQFMKTANFDDHFTVIGDSDRITITAKIASQYELYYKNLW